MTAMDRRAALDWVAVCTDALAAGHDWRPDSDVFTRALPTADRVGPYLLAAYLHRREQAGDDPRTVLQHIEHCLLILAVADAPNHPNSPFGLQAGPSGRSTEGRHR